ncbi:MAG: DUF3987 domain-containing protein [Candidatus Nanopelagicales bacterium]
MTLDMDALRGHEAYRLNEGDGDWASVAAEAITELLRAYVSGGLPAPGALPLPDGEMDPLEEFARAAAAASPSVSLELMLPAGWAFAGALGQGGLWAAWNGRKTVQVTPLTYCGIGLASSGRGKSTQLNLWDQAFKPAMAVGEGAVMKAVGDWAEAAHAAVNQALEADGLWLTSQGPAAADECVDFAKAKKGVHRLIDQIDLGVGSGVLSVYSDATAEALVSCSIEYGGAAFIRSAEQDMLDNLTRYSSAGAAGASLTLFTDGWDGQDFRRARKGSGPESTSALVLSMALMTQTEAFVRSFVSEAGATWLAKGLLGRALVCRESLPDVNEVLDADVALRAEAGAGEALAGAVADLEERFCTVACAGAGARAARLLEGRLGRALEGAGAAGGGAGGGGGEKYLKKGLAAARGAAAVPVSRVSIARAGAGAGAGAEAGVVLWVEGADAVRLEDLHIWLARVQDFCLDGEGAAVLGPVLSRWSYHLVRIAGIRQMVADPEGLWAAGGVVGGGWLADTAVRLGPWLLHHHLAALGAFAGARAVEEVRQDWLKGRGEDTSMGGQVLRAMAKAGLGPGSFPMAVGTLSERLARGHKGHREYRDGIRAYFREQYDAQAAGGPGAGDGYFLVAKGHKAGTAIVAGFGPASGVQVTGAAKVVLAGGSGSGGGGGAGGVAAG